jgi:dienelactone hydrolase
MKTENIIYKDKNNALEATISYNKSKVPLILIFHAWRGKDDFVIEKTKEFANQGYIGLALDIYGNGITCNDKDECAKLMAPFIEDRNLLKNRILAGYNMAKGLDIVDSNKIAAIGFCFGGLCALDLARSGVDIKGVVSFHGLLMGHNLSAKTIPAKILVLHGHDDPMVSPDEVLNFEKEMNDKNVDWQLHAYGKTMHAFTNPFANDKKFGTVYNPTASKRAFQTMYNFMGEIFC